MRALRSPAISERASKVSVRRKASLKPRTPTRAATPTATDKTTNANFPGADFRSRQPIAAARFQLNARLAICLLVLGDRQDQFPGLSVLDHDSVLQDDFAIRLLGNLGVVCHKNESRLLFPVASQEQVENKAAVAGVEVAGWLIGHHDRRIDNESARKRDALLLTA